MTGWTESAIAWLDQVLGRSPWPQTTVVEGLDAPGEGMPMLSIAASPSRAEILRLLGHTWLAEVIGIDGWSDGWLDNGLTNFQSTWYFQTLGERGAYERLERTVLDWDLDGLSEPVALPPRPVPRSAPPPRQWSTSAGSSSSTSCGPSWAATSRCARSSGPGTTSTGSGTPRATIFSRLPRRVSGADLAPLSTQWLHGTALYDYALEGCRSSQR